MIEIVAEAHDGATSALTGIPVGECSLNTKVTPIWSVLPYGLIQMRRQAQLHSDKLNPI